MAVIEIAKIQIRRGQKGESGMPQLDSGELGWAVDTQELWIGNGSVAEGAPAVGNTEILTSKNIANFFSIGAPYQYGSSYNTGVLTLVDVGNIDTNNTIRSTVAKLDDFVNVIDFGATGQGLVDDAPAIQLAINQLYLNSDKLTANSRKPLRIPAGTYIIGETLLIPPYATLIGDGPGKTVLTINTSSNLMRFCDANGHTLGALSGTIPYVHIEGISFEYTNPAPVGFNIQLPLISLDAGENCHIINCFFKGLYQTSGASSIGNSNLNDTTDVYSGIQIRSQNAGLIETNNVLIKDCVFIGLKYGILSYDDSNNINVVNNRFDTLNRGIHCPPGSPFFNGMSEARISNNSFLRCFNEGIFIGFHSYPGVLLSQNNVTANNVFDNVGNGLTGDSTPISSSINFRGVGNSSHGDKFSRDAYILPTNGASNYYPTILGKTNVVSNTAYTATIATVGILANIPYTGNDQSININYLYTANSGGVDISRRGNLLIDVSSKLLTAVPTDTYSYSYTYGSGDPEPLNGVTFITNLYTATNLVNVTYYSGYTSGLIEYQINYLS
jgi:hypothetical protein